VICRDVIFMGSGGVCNVEWGSILLRSMSDSAKQVVDLLMSEKKDDQIPQTKYSGERREWIMDVGGKS
jgi:hypothetical protein